MPENYNSIGFQDPTSYTNLGPAEEAQKKVFGEYTKKDINDYSNLAYTAMMKEQEQAFTTAMYNYNNWYNSEAQQMKRRLAAGLNPYSDGVTSGNVSAAPSPSAPVVRPTAGLSMKQAQNTNNAIGNLIEVARSAVQMYQTLFGTVPLQQSQIPLNQQRSSLTGVQADRLLSLTPLEAERLGLSRDYQAAILDRYNKLSPLLVSDATARNDWNLYWMYGPGYGPNSPAVDNGPRAHRFQLETSRLESQIEQLKYLVTQLYPSQVQRNQALTALDKYRESLMQGQNDAILSISTGNDQADAWLRFLSFFIKDAASSMVPSFGFSGKLF